MSGILTSWKRRQSARNQGALSQGQGTGSCSWAINQGSSRRKVTQDIQSHEEKMWVAWSWEEILRVSHWGIGSGSVSHAAPVPASHNQALLFLHHQPWECTNPDMQLLAMLPCQAHVLVQGLLAALKRAHVLMCSFSGEVLDRCSATELCGFGKRESCTWPVGLARTTPNGDCFDLSSHVFSGPALLSSFHRETGALLRSGSFRECLHQRLLSGSQMGMTTEPRGSWALALSWGLGQHHPQRKTVLICPLKSQ